jgi:two-component system, OmpR family, sensor kinase
MSSSPPADRHPASRTSVLRGLVPRSLTGRLIVTTLALVALVSIVVVTVTTLAMRHYLLTRLDAQLVSAGKGGHGLPPNELAGVFPGGCLNSQPGVDGSVIDFGFGQADGTLIGWFYGDQGVAVVISDNALCRVSRADNATIAALPVSAGPRTITLGNGEFRVSVLDDQGIRSVTGLPTADVTDTVNSLLLWEVLVAIGGVGLAGLIGQELVRRQLTPLKRVAATATAVTRLPLDSGEVGEIPRVPSELTDPATEAGQVGAAFNSMLGHVEQALDTRHESEQRVRRFLADASHELRTPLSTILGYAELTRRTSSDPAAMTHAMSRIQAESGRMADLVNDLLLLARLDSGRPLERTDVDVSRLLAETVNDARVLGAHHVWRLELPPEPLHVEGDRDRLHQVVANLLTNAIRHTPEGTTVSVSAAGVPREGNGPHGVIVTVHDDGPGIPKSVVGKEFERFSRGDTSRTRSSGGAGLGLSIVQAIVAAHSGTVDIRSAAGDTTITVRLPYRATTSD